MSSKLIETHAHIYSEEFDEDRDACIERAEERGVSTILMPNVDHTSIERMLACEQKYNSCMAQMGLHPCYVKENFEEELKVVEEWLAKRDFVAVGEIGLDYYWDKTFIEQQKEAFKLQMDWAVEKEIPVVIHSRDSTHDVIDILREKKQAKLTGVFHCFGGTIEEANQIIEQGFYIGLGGVSTFKNAKMNEVIPHIDINKIVLETDCPYLAPVPHRGKRNEVSFISDIAQHIADMYKIDYDQFCTKTTANAELLFKL